MDVKTSHAGRRHIAIHSHMPQGTESKHLQPEKHRTMLMWMMEMNDYVKKIKKSLEFSIYPLFSSISAICNFQLHHHSLSTQRHPQLVVGENGQTNQCEYTTYDFDNNIFSIPFPQITQIRWTHMNYETLSSASFILISIANDMDIYMLMKDLIFTRIY